MNIEQQQGFDETFIYLNESDLPGNNIQRQQDNNITLFNINNRNDIYLKKSQVNKFRQRSNY